MIGAQKRLGVEFTTGHWEFTYGAQRVRQAVERELAPVEFLAQNVRNADFEELVFKPYALRTVNGVPLAVIGQAFPYTPIANPRHFVAEWTFGIRESALQKTVDETRARGAQVVVLLSHNGMDVDLKLARRVRGIDVILGGHTHDGVPEPTVVGETLVTNAGSHGKFLAVLDLDASGGKVRGWRYKLLPVFANLLPADAQMQAYIDEVRAPYSAKLSERLAITEGLLYRRGNFNGTFDQLILDALMAVKGTEIAFSPGFRWGGTLLPGDAIRFEHVMDQTAITYPAVTVNDFTGARIKEILEDVCDNLFHLDPYLQQGGDMVRVGGMTYTCDPRAAMGARISDLRLNGAPMQADKAYKVAGWASVAEDVAGEPVWDVVARYLRERRTIAPLKLNLPRLVHVEGDPGIA
jgi:sulfur-oxidizing protein SoxB